MSQYLQRFVWCSFHSTEDLHANQRREKWMIFFRESTLWGDISRQGGVGISGAYPISYFPHLIGFYFGFRFSYLHFDRKNFSSSSWFWLLSFGLASRRRISLVEEGRLFLVWNIYDICIDSLKIILQAATGTATIGGVLTSPICSGRYSEITNLEVKL